MKLVTPDERDDIAQVYPISEAFSISNEIEFIKYKRIPDESLCKQSGSNYNKYLLKNKGINTQQILL